MRVGESIGDIGHAAIDAKLRKPKRASGSTWTADVLHRPAGIAPIDGYRILHGLLQAVSLSAKGGGEKSPWRERAAAEYRALLPTHPTPRTIPVPPMYVPNAAIEGFATALHEFLKARGIPLTPKACRTFLERPAPDYGVSFREASARSLAAHVRWAIDDEVWIGDVTAASFAAAIEKLDQAYAETIKRRRPLATRAAARRQLAKKARS